MKINHYSNIKDNNHGIKKESKSRQKNRSLFVLSHDNTWKNVMESDIKKSIDDGKIIDGDLIVIPRIVKVVKKELVVLTIKSDQ